MNVIDAIIKIKGILQDQFDIDPNTISDATKLSEIGIDSLHLVDVMLDLETDLDITFENLDFSPETTLNNLAEIVSVNFNKVHDY